MNPRKIARLASIGLAIALLSSAPVGALPVATCDAAWKDLDRNGDGTVVGAAAAPYLADLKAANALDYDPTILTAELFMKGCQGDLFKTAMPKAASGAAK